MICVILASIGFTTIVCASVIGLRRLFIHAVQESVSRPFLIGRLEYAIRDLAFQEIIGREERQRQAAAIKEAAQDARKNQKHR
jgi:hypothetical protein